MTSARKIKQRVPRPEGYTVSASMSVPEYVGPFGWPMTTVRITVKGSSMSEPSHAACMRRLSKGREKYLRSIPCDVKGSGDAQA